MFSGGNDKQPVRIALVGCGEVCEHKHLPALRRVRGARVVAVVDPDLPTAARLAERFSIPHCFSDVGELLDAELSDVVGVLTPPAAHAAVGIAALEADRTVLIEKPMTLSMEDAEALTAAESVSAGRAVMGLHMRWHRLVQRARTAVRNGEVGEVESVRIVWSSPRGDVGTPSWKRSRRSGGGALVELGVHVFDLWRFLTGAEVFDVFAMTRHGVRHDERALVTATLENGVLAGASLSERSGHDLEINIAGNQGRLRIGCQRFDAFERYARHETDGMLGPRLRHLLHSVRELPGGLYRMSHLGDYGDSYRGEWHHVVNAANGAPPACTLDDGLKALRVVLAAVASTTENRPVEVEDAPRTLAELAADG